jgi:uncharacterized protein YndB with AHSA1/START domain
MKDKITVETTVNAPIQKVWELYNDPKHVTRWNNASEDWHTPKAENDLTVGGRFSYRMESRDGSEGFDFSGVYEEVEKEQHLSYIMDDGRRVRVNMSSNSDNETKVTIAFDPENENSMEMQEQGWQAILDNFKKYAEEN